MPFFNFRPEHDTRVDDLTDPVDWEDNPISNALAATSFYLLPRWCQSPTHFSTRIVNYFYTTCPCCMFWRAATLTALPLLFIILALILAIVIK